jgi:hypothetical protein
MEEAEEGPGIIEPELAKQWFGGQTRAGVACTVYPVRRIREFLFDASGRTGLSQLVCRAVPPGEWG